MGWLLRVAIVILVVGIAAFDGISVVVAHMNGTDDANEAAYEASQAYQQTHSVAQAIQAASEAITNPHEELVPNSVVIAPDGVVHLKIRREITTLVMYRIPPLKKYTVVVITGESAQPTT